MSKNNRNFPKKLECLKKCFEDDAFMLQYGLYVKRAGKFIAPKIQDIVYERAINNIDLEKILPVIIKNTIKRIKDIGYVRKRRSGAVFLLPYSATFALVPGDYLACRVNKSMDEVLFIDQINCINEFSGDKVKGQENYFGCSTLICGVLFATEDIEEKLYQESYDSAIEYVNDFITSYRLIRHDHTIYKLTKKTLPSNILGYYFTIQDCQIKDAKLKDVKTGHLHDIIDLSNKLLWPYEEIKDDFAQYCEVLPYHKEIRYILDIMLDTLNCFCLGKYEDVVLFSDRYMELSLQVIFNKVPGLETVEFPDCIYSRKPNNRAAIPMITEKIGLKGDAIISKWWQGSREVRNNLVHNLSSRNITEKQAMQCMRYNFELIYKIIDKLSPDNTNPIVLLKLGYQKYEELFKS